MLISIIVLALVLLLIVVRQIWNIKLKIWQIMFFGAVIVLVTGEISFVEAFKAVNLDVIFFLIFMFIFGSAIEESGYLSHLSYKVFKRAQTLDYLILLILFIFGFFAAILMNDTVAIIGVPAVLLLSRVHKINLKILLLTLAFSITIGSVMSPIGNPQNLLIAIQGNIKNPFLVFLKYLFIPTIINLFLTFFLIKLFYKNHFSKTKLDHTQEPIKNQNLARLSKISLILLIMLIILKILIVSFFPSFDFRLTYIALISALPVLIFSKERISLVKKADWGTIVFFISMFVLMASVWNSGFFQSLISNSEIDLTNIFSIMVVGTLLSQLISNVPLVALYLPILMESGISEIGLMALVVSSTIAGNFLIFGAASNVIIIENVEKRSNETITFFEFAKIGIPLTILNLLIYYLYFLLMRII